MEHFSINNTNNNINHFKGTFLTSSDSLNIENIDLVSKDKYNRLLRKSILFSLQWLENNVFINDKDGYKIKKTLDNGIKFNSETNQYLINACYFWKKILEKRNNTQPDQIANHNNKKDLLSICIHNSSTKCIKNKIKFDDLCKYKSSNNILLSISKDSIDFNSLIMVNDFDNETNYIPHFPVKHNDHWDILPVSYINTKIQNT